MQGGPAERFSWLYVSSGSSGFRLNLAKEPAVTLRCTGPATSDGECSSRGGLQPWRHWMHVVQMKEWAEILPSGNGCTPEDDGTLMLDVTLGKMGTEGELALTFSFKKRRDSFICRDTVRL